MEETLQLDERSQRLGTEKIGSLLWKFALPAIVAMLVASLYNIIDRIFIGNGVGPMAIAAMGLVLPFMNITAAFGAMVGAGASAMVSIRMGQQRKEAAINILCNTLVLNCIIGGLVTLSGLFFLDDILRLFGASSETLPYARDFMQIILVANMFNHNFLGLNNIMRACGYPNKAMFSSLLTVALNVVLAPIFIFVFEWGIRGAALATALAQFSGFLWVMLHFLNPKRDLHFQRGHFRLRVRIVADILSIGMSPFLMNMCASVLSVLINRGLVKYGGIQSDLAIGAYGICNTIAMLFIMAVLGLNMGMQPIVGYNFGARKNQRMLDAYRKTLVAATCITTIGFLISRFFARPIVSAFTNHEEMVDLAEYCLKTIMVTFPIVGFQMVTTNFFQSIGKAAWSIFLSLSRQLIFLLPGILIFPYYFGMYGVWYAMPAGDLIASILTLVVILLKIKKYTRYSPSNP